MRAVIAAAAAGSRPGPDPSSAGGVGPVTDQWATMRPAARARLCRVLYKRVDFLLLPDVEESNAVSILDSVRPLVAADEQLQYAFTAQTGVPPSLLWIPLLRFAVISNRARIVVVTDRRIAVFSAGQLSWKRRTPKALLYSVSRQTPLPHGSGAWSAIQLGPQRLWVGRLAYPSLDEINAGISAGRPGPGWFADPDGAELMRWWDGTTWTAQTRSA